MMVITPMLVVPMFDICYPMASFISRTVVFVIDMVTVVAVPGRIGIISCVGISLTSYRSGGRGVSVVINGNGGANYRDGYRNRYAVDPGKADAYMGVDVYLGVTGSSYEAGGDDRGEDK
jgi:hypothetical protein